MTIKLSDHRNYGIDALRMFSMFLVLFLHILNHGGILANLEYTKVNFWLAWFLEIIAYCAVNAFALISGFAGIYSKYRWSKMLLLWFQVLFYSLGLTLILKFFTLPIESTIGLNRILKSCFPILTGQYWYLTAYFGMSIFTIFLQSVTIQCSFKQFVTIMLSAFLVICILPKLLHGSSDLFGVNSGYSMFWLSYLYLLGAGIRKFNIMTKIRLRYTITGFFLSTVFVFGFKWFVTTGLRHPELADVFVSYLSPFILLNAIFLLVTFSNLKITLVPFSLTIKCQDVYQA